MADYYPLMAGAVSKLHTNTPETKHAQIIAAVFCVVIVGAWSIQRAFYPDAHDVQAIVDVRTHPLASALGALLPSIILAPFAYWIFGFVLRRIAGRSKGASRLPRCKKYRRNFAQKPDTPCSQVPVVAVGCCPYSGSEE
jgi:hypothetical protein